MKTRLGGPKTGESTIVGTHGYMPAEQLMGHAEPRSDLYALGATLIHLASGRHPSTLPLDGLRLRFADVVNLPAPLIAWLDTLVAPDPGLRPESARVTRATLDAALQPSVRRPSQDPTLPPKAVPEKRPRYDAWGAWLAGLGTLVVIGMLVVSRSERAPGVQPATLAKPVPATRRVAGPSPFVALTAELEESEAVVVAPRRSMLRKAEMGFPHSSVDLAVVLTSKVEKPIVSLTANVFLLLLRSPGSSCPSSQQGCVRRRSVSSSPVVSVRP